MSHAGMIVISNSKAETEAIINRLLDTEIDYALDRKGFDEEDWIPMIDKNGEQKFFARYDDIDWDRTSKESLISIIATKNSYNQYDNEFPAPDENAGKYVEFFDVHI